VTDTKAPPRYKMALLTWAGAFPLLTAVNVLLGPVLVALPLPGRTLLITGLLIGLLTYVIMPRLTRLCATWLSPSGVRGRPDEKVAGRLSRVQDPLSAQAVRCRTA
jgi:antibiotic biosynthesis monooxygenase (ABM) superfamily enzyme